MEKIGLTIGERRWSGWKIVTVQRSIEQAASVFSLDLTIRQIGDPLPIDLKPGAGYVLYAGDDKMITGIIDNPMISDDENSTSISVSGRSKTSRLIKNSHDHPSGEFLKLTAVQIAQQIAALHGIDIIVNVPAGKAIKSHRLQLGEKAFQAIERLGRDAGWLMTDDAEGRLVLTRAGSTIGDPLVYGQSNVKRWDYNANSSERYTQYRVVGQRAGDDTNFGDSVASSSALAFDDEWTDETYPLTIKAEGQADPASCQRRADWEAATRAGRATTLTCRVNGWRQNDGTLWTPNTIHRCTYPRAKLDRNLLLVSVEFTQGNDGEFTTLSLAPISGFDPEPTVTEIKKRRKKKGDGIWSEDWLK